MVARIALGVMALALAGCAGMNEQECAATDWRAAGFEDGSQGYTEASIGRYRKACSKHGVTPDLSEYRAGHYEGTLVYCQPQVGYNAGRRGRTYHGVCPADLEPEFLAAYSQGRELHSLESAVSRLSSQISVRKAELKDLREEIADDQAALIADGATSEERARLLLDIKNKSEEVGTLEAEIDELERDRAVAADDLYRYKETVASDF